MIRYYEYHIWEKRIEMDQEQSNIKENLRTCFHLVQWSLPFVLYPSSIAASVYSSYVHCADGAKVDEDTLCREGYFERPKEKRFLVGRADQEGKGQSSVAGQQYNPQMFLCYCNIVLFFVDH